MLPFSGKFLSIACKSVVSALVVAAVSGAGAFAADGGTAQLFNCKSTGNVSFRYITSKEKQFDYGNTNQVAVLVSNGSGGTTGVSLQLPTQTFNYIRWYFREARGSNALKQLKVKYCFTVKATGERVQKIVDGGVSASVSSQKDGWSVLDQNNKVFPANVVFGAATIDRIEFIFDNSIANNITLGKVVLDTDAVSTLILDTAGCEGEADCVEIL